MTDEIKYNLTLHGKLAEAMDIVSQVRMGLSRLTCDIGSKPDEELGKLEYDNDTSAIGMASALHVEILALRAHVRGLLYAVGQPKDFPHNEEQN